MSKPRAAVETNKHGQTIGRKGADTRQRIIDGTRRLLEIQPGTRLTVTAVARAAGISAPTFYLYFKDTDDVLLALSDEAARDIDGVLRILREPWTPEALHEHSQRFVEQFYLYWGRHREVLSMRNLQSDLGVEAFNEVRRRAAMPIVEAIAARIRAAGATEARARAVIIYAAIERLAGRSSTAQLQMDDLPSEELMRAEADILTLLFTPAAPTP